MGLILFAWRFRLSARWLISPGHWLLCTLGIVFVLEFALEFVSQSIFTRTNMIANAVACWMFVLPLFSARANAHWKAFFAVMVFLYGVPLVVSCAVGIGIGDFGNHGAVSALLAVSGPVSVGSLCMACCQDWMRGERNGWLHWCGVCVFAIVMLQAIARG